ncbi:hypothetical protein Zmor_011617 [Zophobas morio]|uniref:Uncharacterized protein n=1 Tax=Zophobas morio TaxID=2755281 RepID=A0AA38IRF3_9CUCU|nr:hypothetical protein Zmor_011617 [Zophobas morio]
MQLFSAKQRNKSIYDFGRDFEELMFNLTIAQTDGNDTASGILANTNEKLAISAFANGLRDENLRLITRARGFSTLTETTMVRLKSQSSSKIRSKYSICEIRVCEDRIRVVEIVWEIDKEISGVIFILAIIMEIEMFILIKIEVKYAEEIISEIRIVSVVVIAVAVGHTLRHIRYN